jgi:hypothetical protein
LDILESVNKEKRENCEGKKPKKHQKKKYKVSVEIMTLENFLVDATHHIGVIELYF